MLTIWQPKVCNCTLWNQITNCKEYKFLPIPCIQKTFSTTKKSWICWKLEVSATVCILTIISWIFTLTHLKKFLVARFDNKPYNLSNSPYDIPFSPISFSSDSCSLTWMLAMASIRARSFSSLSLWADSRSVCRRPISFSFSFRVDILFSISSWAAANLAA